MTLYRGFFNKDKERKKSVPTKKWCYSECDVIEGDVIGRFDCNFFCILQENSFADFLSHFPEHHIFVNSSSLNLRHVPEALIIVFVGYPPICRKILNSSRLFGSTLLCRHFPNFSGEAKYCFSFVNLIQVTCTLFLRSINKGE